MFKKRLLAFILAVICLFSVGCTATGGFDDGPIDLSTAINIDIFALNDVHGNVFDTQTTLSIAKTSTFIKSQREQNPNTVLLSSGDIWQGSSESNNTKGKIMTEWMNGMGVSAMTLGNHEFDWGVDRIRENGAIANFPFLGINVIDLKTGERADFCQASTVIEVGGVKIGIIGAIGDCYSSISSRWVKDLRFATGSELTSLVKAESTRLRGEGVEIVIYSIHDGYDQSTYRFGREEIVKLGVAQTKYYYDQTLSNGYVDLVFEGHTHKNTVYTDTFGVYHFQAGGNNGAIAHADLYYDKKDGDIKVEGALEWASSNHDLKEEPLTLSLFDKYAQEIGDVHSTIGVNERFRSSKELCALTASLYLELGEKEWADYDVFLGGGFLRPRSPYDLEKGNVTYSDLQSLFPFDNYLVLCSILGADLKRNFIYTSNEDYYNAYSQFGYDSMDSIVDGETYYVVVDTYTSDYAYNNLTVVEYYKDDDYFARDLLADYFKNGGLSLGN